ncbi:hypothetical protein HID58_043410 [Brassica napus]|uniref:Uncharacterized protein n=1 Tax=Brassica napus TaxID=3708 RepID=A0ABQ8BHI1_BRANA|nr:hypothetical protein HID58_043410 [Brassica napus]
MHFNKDRTAIKKLHVSLNDHFIVYAGVNKLADLVGVTLSRKGRNVALVRKYGFPRIVNDGDELEDTVENTGAKLLVMEQQLQLFLRKVSLPKVMAADANPVLNYQKNREYHQGSCCRVEEDVKGDSELADVAVVSSGNNYDVGNMIAKALAKVGFKGVFTLEEGKSFVLLDLERGKVSTLMILLLLLEVRPND